ncbi:hypothetical protein SS1G_14156 [Sclerotinia sclerotiorum 1980 UF-70]|uniref:C3H1-type domain-containing protein n=1 Tax=Sclerotinia sclerotiorum (strain ATCC 18683 / 1980 / Ss-1) TaxID=665079 RepID=A7F975_SCLS1|nr:hypothetical protein SS1G_14156 [Sclerotinia sclerotiorum 1980 UF-70]EDO00286.1 hypothetical protein SS1G_14156 [Sclerotinia sclerotiorum 1980 UF-70]
MAATRFNQPELRRPTSSPRPKGRENAKDTLCRNVLIYGHCRYEDQGCAFNHDPNKGLGGGVDHIGPEPISEFIFDITIDQSLVFTVQNCVDTWLWGHGHSFWPLFDLVDGSYHSWIYMEVLPAYPIFTVVLKLHFLALPYLCIFHVLMRNNFFVHQQRINAGMDIFKKLNSVKIPTFGLTKLADGEEDQQDEQSDVEDQLDDEQDEQSDVEDQLEESSPVKKKNRRRRRRYGQRSSDVPHKTTAATGFSETTKAFRENRSPSLSAQIPGVTSTEMGSPHSILRSPHTQESKDTMESLDLKLSNPEIAIKATADPTVERPKKALNVDSPSFTPAALPASNKGASVISQAANAAPFTPRGLASGTATPNTQLDPEIPQFNPTQRDFTPQNYDLSQNIPTNGATPEAPYDPFSMGGVSQAIPTSFSNHYQEDISNLAAGVATGGAYFQGQPSYNVQPLNYHFYAPIGPHTDNLTPYQKSIHDLFLSDRLREELQRKSEASHQVMLTIRAVKKWNEVNSAGVVSFIDAFTTRQFKDNSLIIVTNYHPLSKTLLEVHFSATTTNRYGSRLNPRIPEDTLWAYIAQITLAIKAVHQANFAVRCMHLTKVILTDKNRIRLNACPIFDILHYEYRRDIKELQSEDLCLFGVLMLSLATVNATITPQTTAQVLKTNLEGLSRFYSVELIDTIRWLLTTPSTTEPKDLETFMRGISGRMTTALDSSLQAHDEITSELYRELENGRLVRLMAKLGNINERPEYDTNVQWSEVGERYILKLFRDYVFHPVDADGRPVTDMAWILKCLNKLDAGSDEKIQLTSRDGENCFIVSFKDIKKQVNAAWGDLQKPGKRF